MKTLKRKKYLDKLIEWKDKQIIKVITGMRRSGKSTLLCELYKNYLIEQGISDKQIIIVNLESIDNENLYHYKPLYEHINNLLDLKKMNYVIIDEVQNAKDFQKAIDSLYIKKNVDVYITGSNAFMLSGELATLLSGRFVTIEVMPLSFKEYHDSKEKEESLEKVYRDYLRWGGLPYIINLENKDNLIRDYLEGIYNTIFKKDIISKNKISDVFVLEDVIRFVFDNIGNITSSKKIADTLSSNGRKISRPTVDSYLDYLINSYTVDKVSRYDIKGKEYLKSLEKYYVIDMGIRNYLLGYRNIDRGHVLENVVYLELKRRGYEIYIGKYEDKEIDFVVKNNEEVYYIQVAETIKTEEILKREIEPLRAVEDYHSRILITQDYDVNKSYDGIKVFNVFEWLLSDKYII